ncbi:MAG TPA: DsbA family oxidoreductase [Sphingobium sp.]
MTTAVRIDFVSDISCPWCIIGLQGLEAALARVAGEIEAEITFRPFELNPDMAPGGENMGDHITRKIGSTREQSAQMRQTITERAAATGFTINFSDDTRVYNTFDAHRLLHWAAQESPEKQRALKHALFGAHFTRGEAMDDSDTLVAIAEKAGLDGAEARDVLTSGRYEAEVRQEEALWRSRGINSVPAIILNQKYLISGGQPADAFEEALRTIAAETVAS